jgi:hypothetical protein
MRTIVINNPGPQGSTGPQGVAGPSGSTQPFNNVSGDTWATTSSLQVSGSFLVSGSSTFTNIGPAIFSGSATITGATTMSSAVVSGDVTVLGTASINVLQINNTINSTGSNILGDNVNDTQTLYGTVVIPTGSLTVSGTAQITGNINLPNQYQYIGLGINDAIRFANGEVRVSTSTTTGNFSVYSPSYGLTAFRVIANGNTLIGTTTDTGYRLNVSGSVIIRGSGSTSATDALVVQNNIGTNLLTIKNANDAGTYNLYAPGGGRFGQMEIVDTSIGAGGGANVFFPYNRILFGGNTGMNTSAQVQIDSTTRGFLPPRTATTASITSPAQGLITYLTGSTNEGLYYYNSGSQVGWHKMLTNTGSQSITGSLTISGVTTFAQGSSVNGSGNLSIGAFAIHSAYGYATFSQTTLLLTGGTFTSTTGNQVGLSFGGGFTPTSGTATYSAYSILPTINQTGGANGITRGLFIDPTLTAAANFRAIETTSGSISFNHGSTPLIFASTNGNVGIGTGSAAAYKFQVRNGDIALDFNRFLRGGFDNNWSTINLYNGSTGDMEISLFNQSWYLRHNANATFAGNVGIGLTGSISPRLQVRGSGTTSATTALRVENTNASASLVVLDNGFVGINTGSAQYNLDVNGSARLGGTRAIINTDVVNALTLSPGTIGYTGNLIRINGGNGSAYVGIDGSGAFSLGDGSLVLNAFTTNKSIILATQGTERVRITSTGLVQITGSVNISSVLTLTPQSPLPSGVATGSFAVSSSVPPKPYFYDGTTWNALY